LEPWGTGSKALRSNASQKRSSFRANLEQLILTRKAFMKLANLKTKRIDQRAALNRPPGSRRKPFTKPMVAPHQIHTYAELRRQIHDDLRIQHPEWVLPNGDCPMCDAYEARLMKVLETLTRSGSDQCVVSLHRALEHGLN
jgi:hypothetical protein